MTPYFTKNLRWHAVAKVRALLATRESHLTGALQDLQANPPDPYPHSPPVVLSAPAALPMREENAGPFRWYDGAQWTMYA
ncbi:hypothetical protein [Rhodococcus erythropolis]|uniref:hypothetical protein n=1 Tax=Rhodococcus erythropolis TaxID=1833 RepID=UPI001BE9C061|nr:hypothetical protein [Rhodococcus erythropolis]MBT2266121.1 hypothetical protein [Rhodococcus erythropolis]